MRRTVPPGSSRPAGCGGHSAISQRWPAGSRKLAVREPQGRVHRPVQERDPARRQLGADRVHVVDVERHDLAARTVGRVADRRRLDQLRHGGDVESRLISVFPKLKTAESASSKISADAEHVRVEPLRRRRGPR